MPRTFLLTLHDAQIKEEFLEEGKQIRIVVLTDRKSLQSTSFHPLEANTEFNSTFTFNFEGMQNLEHIFIGVWKFDEAGNRICTLAGAFIKIAKFPWNSKEKFFVDINPPGDTDVIAGQLSFSSKLFHQNKQSKILRIFIQFATVSPKYVDEDSNFQVEILLFGATARLTPPKKLTANAVLNSTQLFDYPKDGRQNMKVLYLTVYKTNRATGEKETIAKSATLAWNLISNPGKLTPIECLDNNEGTVMVIHLWAQLSSSYSPMNTLQVKFQNIKFRPDLIENGKLFVAEFFLFGASSHITAPLPLSENLVFDANLHFDYPRDSQSNMKVLYINIYKIESPSQKRQVFAKAAICVYDLIMNPGDTFPAHFLIDGKEVATVFLSAFHSFFYSAQNILQLHLEYAWIESRFLERGKQIRVDMFLDGAASQSSPMPYLIENAHFNSNHVLAYRESQEQTINLNLVVSKFDMKGEEKETIAKLKKPIIELPVPSSDLFYIDTPDSQGKQAVRLFFKASVSIPNVPIRRLEAEFKVLKIYLRRGWVETRYVEKNTQIQVDISLNGTGNQTTPLLYLIENPTFNTKHMFTYQDTADDEPVNLYISVVKYDSKGLNPTVFASSVTPISELSVNTDYLFPIDSKASDNTEKPAVRLFFKAKLYDADIEIDKQTPRTKGRVYIQKTYTHFPANKRPDKIIGQKKQPQWRYQHSGGHPNLVTFK